MANPDFLRELYSLDGQVAVVTGGTGVLGSEMARGLARAGAQVAIMGRRAEQAERVAQEITALGGGAAMALPADVGDAQQLTDARDRLLEKWGRVDILLNAAGGNVPAATITDDKTIFDLEVPAFEQVLSLNLTGTVRPSLIFGQAMANRKEGQPSGCIVNVSSMTSQRVVTRVVGYSAGKAAVESFTKWMAVELARKLGEGLRVNAIAPGFFIGEQNRALLLTPEGQLTERGKKIVDHTPAGRFGEPSELVSTLVWLCGPGARFVTGVVVPVDGGFSVFSGV
ncbi:MAG TPA: SDR family oxidoreductase [Chloroflexota bacterium]|nr:SDR family oxidoreductase [Chloroflexota bacterium]